MNVTNESGDRERRSIRNPVPKIVRVNGLDPTWAEDGDRPVIVGCGFVTAKLNGCELPPPGGGFVTTTGNVPAVARSEVVRVMVS